MKECKFGINKNRRIDSYIVGSITQKQIGHNVYWGLYNTSSAMGLNILLSFQFEINGIGFLFNLRRGV